MSAPRLQNVLYVVASAILVAVAVAMYGARPGPSTFVVPPALPLPEVVRADYYPQPPAAGAAHAPSAVLLADGRIALYWFAGSREGASDVVLRTAIFDGAVWSPPAVVTDAAKTTADEGRRAFTVGNPVVFQHPGGDYWLIYVTSIGDGWGGSSLNLMRSADGLVWGPARRLTTSPFLNLSTLVRAPPLIRSDGLVVLPAYHEMTASLPEFIMLDANGSVVDRARTDYDCLIQPWLVPLGAGRAMALMRQHGCVDRHLFTTTTADGGASWSQSTATTFANPDSPAAALRLADGRIVAVFSDDSQFAWRLDLMVSADDGATWKRGAPVFDGTATGKSYRYPWLLQDVTGRLHVFASESQQAIRQAIIGLDAVPAP